MGTRSARRKVQTTEADGRKLSVDQIRAIRAEVAIGDDIRRNHPEVARQYREGMTAPELVEELGFGRMYGVSTRLAAAAVRYAIRGNAGPFHPPYEGLIPDSAERELLALEHDRASGRLEYTFQRGIHGLSHEEKVEYGRQGGLIGGPLSYELKIGCHGLAPGVLREHCRRIAALGGKAGGKAAAKAKGQVPYAPAELKFAAELASDPEYCGPVRANFRKIAAEVNQAYHDGRPHYTRIATKIALQRYRRHKAAGKLVVNAELAFAERLTLVPAYQIAPRVKVSEIARRLNDEYHGGKPVRNAGSVKAALRRYWLGCAEEPEAGLLRVRA